MKLKDGGTYELNDGTVIVVKESPSDKGILSLYKEREGYDGSIFKISEIRTKSKTSLVSIGSWYHGTGVYGTYERNLKYGAHVRGALIVQTDLEKALQLVVNNGYSVKKPVVRPRALSCATIFSSTRAELNRYTITDSDIKNISESFEIMKTLEALPDVPKPEEKK